MAKNTRLYSYVLVWCFSHDQHDQQEDAGFNESISWERIFFNSFFFNKMANLVQ